VALELEALADASIQVLGASMPETPQDIPSEEVAEAARYLVDESLLRWFASHVYLSR
jgi:hypothetical protein